MVVECFTTKTIPEVMISISYETSKSGVERITELGEQSRSLVTFFSYHHGTK